MLPFNIELYIELSQEGNKSRVRRMMCKKKKSTAANSVRVACAFNNSTHLKCMGKWNHCYSVGESVKGNVKR